MKDINLAGHILTNELKDLNQKDVYNKMVELAGVNYSYVNFNKKFTENSFTAVEFIYLAVILDIDIELIKEIISNKVFKKEPVMFLGRVIISVVDIYLNMIIKSGLIESFDYKLVTISDSIIEIILLTNDGSMSCVMMNMEEDSIIVEYENIKILRYVPDFDLKSLESNKRMKLDVIKASRKVSVSSMLLAPNKEIIKGLELFDVKNEYFTKENTSVVCKVNDYTVNLLTDSPFETSQMISDLKPDNIREFEIIWTYNGENSKWMYSGHVRGQEISEEKRILRHLDKNDFISSLMTRMPIQAKPGEVRMMKFKTDCESIIYDVYYSEPVPKGR